MYTRKPSRSALALFSFCALLLAGLTFTTPKVDGAKNSQPVIRAVRLGGVSLSPTTISSNGSEFGTVAASATITVSVATSVEVVNGTVARVELTYDTNPNGVDFTVSGGNVAGSEGRVSNVTLRGKGVPETIRYTVTAGTTNSAAGSVQIRVNLRSATNPPNTPPPIAITENPTTQTVMLTFQSPPSTGGGGPENDCPPADFAGDIYYSTCTPIIVDVLGNGFNLTDAANGVDFDMNSDGVKAKLSWTAADSDDAFLTLDRNGDGQITLGAELFGYWTPQPASSNRHGFLALAEFDKPLDGGNGDGVINEADDVFLKLRLWQDKNHNGISEPNELHPLYERGLRKIELKYKESKRTDEHGNRFRYRAKVWRLEDSKAGRWAWDVFLVPAL